MAGKYLPGRTSTVSFAVFERTAGSGVFVDEYKSLKMFCYCLK